MGWVLDALTGEQLFLIGDISGSSGETTAKVFDPVATSTTYTVSDAKNLIMFTTGASSIQCRFSSPVVGKRYRVQKVDTGGGDVPVLDVGGTVVETLRYQWEFIDILYTDASNYVIM